MLRQYSASNLREQPRRVFCNSRAGMLQLLQHLAAESCIQICGHGVSQALLLLLQRQAMTESCVLRPAVDLGLKLSRQLAGGIRSFFFLVMGDFMKVKLEVPTFLPPLAPPGF